ncbi:hypothetical protein EYF80_013352 [Liparis tanakae]|uniref:Uncharacterized protein n=1 Tax=Liparis tanakae TaxID=230148 RepID=A0A4Z2IF79_9TELE|nr:hypothetical protein EYF80_013352 [Liparis tanakae]
MILGLAKEKRLGLGAVLVGEDAPQARVSPMTKVLFFRSIEGSGSSEGPWEGTLKASSLSQRSPYHVSGSCLASGITNTVMSSPEPSLSLGSRQPRSFSTPRDLISRSWAARVYLNTNVDKYLLQLEICQVLFLTGLVSDHLLTICVKAVSMTPITRFSKLTTFSMWKRTEESGTASGSSGAVLGEADGWRTGGVLQQVTDLSQAVSDEAVEELGGHDGGSGTGVSIKHAPKLRAGDRRHRVLHCAVCTRTNDREEFKVA